MSNATYRVLVEKLGASNPEEFIGNEGEIFYDPEGDVLRKSDGVTPGGIVLGGGGGNAGEWQRPSDWLPMPTVTETDQKFVGLFPVFNTPENFIALYFEGDYTVDWGDGTVENFDSGVKAQHSYSWSDIPSNTLTTEGYRQVLVTVTPQSGENLTVMDLSVKHDEQVSGANMPWNDILLSMPQANSGASLSFGGGPNSLGDAYLYNIRSISIKNPGNMDDMSYMFNTMYNLSSVILLNTDNITIISGIFSGCRLLNSVELFNTSSVTDMSDMFYGCSALKTVPLFNTINVTNMYRMFYGCSALTTVPLFNTINVTNMIQMFLACASLTSVPLFLTSSVNNITSIFLSCRMLQVAVLNGTKENISYQNCLLGRQAIIDIFNGLATVATPKTITITGNYGVADLLPEDYAIATNKGWTVVD